MSALMIDETILLCSGQTHRFVPSIVDKNSLFVARNIGKLSLCVKHTMPA